MHIAKLQFCEIWRQFLFYTFILLTLRKHIMFRPSLLAAALSVVLISSPALAKVDKDAEAASHFLITPAFMQKMKNAEKEMNALKGSEIDDEDNEKSDSSINGIIKKIESTPKARAVLAKHNIAPREMALATYALLHAGMWVATESVMDKKKAAVSYAALTSEQKANIELMRTVAKDAKKK